MSHSSVILLWSSSISMVTLKFWGAIRGGELEQLGQILSWKGTLQSYTHISPSMNEWVLLILWGLVFDFTVSGQWGTSSWREAILVMRLWFSLSWGEKTGILLWIQRRLTTVDAFMVQDTVQHIIAASALLTTCLLCAEARARPSSVQLRAAFISSTSSFSIFSFWASCWWLHRKSNRDSHRTTAALNPRPVCARTGILHPGLAAQLLVLLSQFLVAVLHALHHLLQLPHLLLELLVVHLKVGNTINQLWCLTEGRHTHVEHPLLLAWHIRLCLYFNNRNFRVEWILSPGIHTHPLTLTILLWMLPPQRPPSFLRSYWTVWTSWLKDTHEHTLRDNDVINSSCQEQEKASDHTNQTGCLWVWPSPGWRHLSAPPWDKTDGKNQNVLHQLLPRSFSKNWQPCSVLPLDSLKTCLKWFVELFYFWCLAHWALKSSSPLTH